MEHRLLLRGTSRAATPQRSNAKTRTRKPCICHIEPLPACLGLLRAPESSRRICTAYPYPYTCPSGEQPQASQREGRCGLSPALAEPQPASILFEARPMLTTGRSAFSASIPQLHSYGVWACRFLPTPRHTESWPARNGSGLTQNSLGLTLAAFVRVRAPRLES